jgi:hypothetical protein
MARISFPRAVIRDEFLLRRTLRLRNVLEIDPDAIPDGARAAHPVDQDVRRFQRRRGLGVPGAPDVQGSERLVRVLVRAISISGLPPFGGLSAGPSSSASRSSGSSDPTASSIGSQGSPRSAKRAGTVAIVNSSGRQPGTSSQVNGIDTRASGVARTE